MQPSTCYRHADRVTGVTCTRCGRAICPACMIQAPVGHHCPNCVAEARGDTKLVRQPRWSRPAGATSPTVVVLGLIAINVAVFLLDQGDPTIQFRFADNPLLVARGDFYRLITAAFLHANLLHLGLNMVGLYLFGSQLEAALGRVRFLALYLISALGGGVCFYFFGDLGTFSVGASGAVFGLFGASFVVLRSRGGDTSQIAGLILINLFIGASVPGIDNFAHIGGLLTGGALAFVYERVRGGAGSTAAARHGAAVVVVVALLVTLAGVRGRELRAREGLRGGAPASTGYVVNGVVVGAHTGRSTS